MNQDDLYEATNGRDFLILERHNLTYDWGEVAIFKDSKGQYYIGRSVHPDRGSPYFEHWKIKEEHYDTFKNPTLDGLRDLLRVRFFEQTLFEVFLKRKEREEVLKQFLAESELPKIEARAVQAWCDKTLLVMNDSNSFREPVSLGQFEMPGLVHACQFETDNLLIVDVLYLNQEAKRYEIQRCTLDIEKREIIDESIVDMKNCLKFFTFAKDYPIKPVSFGPKYQFKAKAVQLNYEPKKHQVIISTKTGLRYTYDYPFTAGLGRFWTFEKKASLTLKKSVLFMYSFRDQSLEDSYFVLRFEVKKKGIFPQTKITVKSDSQISFSPNGRMVYSVLKNSGTGSNLIEIVQL